MPPRHVNPKRNPATAPYNFVPLPNAVLTVEDGIEVDGIRVKPWEHHDRLLPGTASGWIDLEVEALTPLYIRGPSVRWNGAWDTGEARDRPEPYTVAGRPAIPGSSLRGMVRNLVEILAFAKIQPVTPAKPFFRTVSDDRIGRAYRTRMLRGGEKPPGGFLRLDHAGIATIVGCPVARLDRDRIPQQVLATRADDVPAWTHANRPMQHGSVWVRVEDHWVTRVDRSAQRPAGEGWQRGTLVLTGSAPRKKAEFVFLEPVQRDDVIRVPDAIWERFHDDDQLTQWQERAFPRDRPRVRARPAAGHLRDGEPVFFLVDASKKSDDNPDGLVFFGRAQMFRFPYDLGPRDLIPEPLREAGLDLPEVLFGRVGNPTIKGRVRFEDAVAAGDPPFTDRTIVPKILAAPKPTAFQHYLTQNEPDDRSRLETYLKGDKTTIRGHKLYWHRWAGIGQVEEIARVPQADTQHTRITPVRAETTFHGRVRFDNLTPIELGALLTALELPEGCAHKLGMGKPLGLGSVRIRTKLTRLDPAARYSGWGASGTVEEGSGPYRTAFERAISDHAEQTGETTTGANGLRNIARLDALFLMLEWEGRPATVGQDLQSFKQRPVLPTPHHVAGHAEPAWAPHAVPPPSRASSPATPPARRSLVQKGQTRDGLVEHRDGRYVALFDGDDRVGEIENQAMVSGPGRATFYVVDGNKRRLRVRIG